MKSHVTSVFFGVRDQNAFCAGLQQAVNEIRSPGVYTGDNLFVFGRNLGFLDDERFMAAVETHTETHVEKATIWRVYVLCWAARRAMKLDGDFVECGCYKGTSARIIADYVRFADSAKHFYLYDLFDHSPDMAHHSMPEHSSELHQRVCRRFADLDNVTVTQGKVPDSFAQAAPAGKIAFLHIDMNNADAELGALERLYDQVVPGAAIIFDDYGWTPYRAQKAVEDRFFAERDLQILELPTGQGLVIV